MHNIGTITAAFIAANRPTPHHPDDNDQCEACRQPWPCLDSILDDEEEAEFDYQDRANGYVDEDLFRPER